MTWWRGSTEQTGHLHHCKKQKVSSSVLQEMWMLQCLNHVLSVRRIFLGGSKSATSFFLSFLSLTLIDLLPSTIHILNWTSEPRNTSNSFLTYARDHIIPTSRSWLQVSSILHWIGTTTSRSKWSIASHVLTPICRSLLYTKFIYKIDLPKW